ncbi:MAG: hypothetical protein RL223_2858 [Pseudomonadota bacterium]|jgi:ferredoxin-NADP reductase
MSSPSLPTAEAVPAPDPAVALPPPWGGDDEWLQCVAVVQETHDVRSFVLRPVEARSWRYRPGQFITLALDIDGQRIWRSYTLSSSPTRPDSVAITVKRVPGGPVSNWLHERLKPGMRLSVSGPAGEFCPPAGPLQAPARGQLYLSAGSGITPLMSMARSWADLGTDVDLHFLHAARTPADRIFGAELDWLATRLPRWRSTLLCEQATPGWHGPVGRIDLALLRRQVPDLLDREVWCCGPAPFMAAVRALLAEAGFDPSRYHEESFSFGAAAQPVVATPAPAAAPLPAAATQPPGTATDAAAPAAAPAPQAAPAAAAPAAAVSSSPDTARYTVTLSKRGERFDCGADETVLQAAQRAGVRWPFACANGVCGTCRTQRSAGEVQMSQNGGLRPREVAQGWFLPCCSRPLGDLTLER